VQQALAIAGTQRGITDAVRRDMLRYGVLCAALVGCVDEPELSTVEQDIDLYCPSVPRSPVTTYRGISGSYVRLGLSEIGEPLRLSLVAEQDDPEARGTFTGLYTGENGLPASYAGTFAALPDNPAIGPVIAFDSNTDGEFDDAYFVLGISRSFGRVRGLCLGGAEHPFQLTRSFY
jgi:hypothetical protein